MQIREDAWLSSVMDRGVFRVEEPDIARISTEIPRHIEGQRHGFYYAKVDSSDVARLRALTGAGFFAVDVNVTFELSKFDSAPAATRELSVHECSAKDAPRVLDIAGSCFRFTRFHLDPLVPTDLAHRIKREWIENYVAKKRGDRLFVCSTNSKPIGFLAALCGGPAREQVATIDLIGVDVAHQRHRAGRALVEAFVNAYRDCKVIQVGTQVANIPSVRFYEKLGFRLARSQYVLHMHVRDGRAQI